MSKILDRIINYIGTYGVFKSPTDSSVTLDGPIKLENNTGIYTKDAYNNYQQLINWNDSDIITLGNTLVSLTGGQLTGLTTISNSTDAVNKQYVDDRTVDYVVDQYLSSGAAGEWSWKKWHSGLFECWASHTLTLTSDGKTGENYYSTSNYINLPIIPNTTYQVQGAVCNIDGGSSLCWASNIGMTPGTPSGTPSEASHNGTIWFRAMRSIAVGGRVSFRISVVCRWTTT